MWGAEYNFQDRVFQLCSFDGKAGTRKYVKSLHSWGKSVVQGLQNCLLPRTPGKELAGLSLCFPGGQWGHYSPAKHLNDVHSVGAEGWGNSLSDYTWFRNAINVLMVWIFSVKQMSDFAYPVLPTFISAKNFPLCSLPYTHTHIHIKFFTNQKT